MAQVIHLLLLIFVVPLGDTSLPAPFWASRHIWLPCHVLPVPDKSRWRGKTPFDINRLLLQRLGLKWFKWLIKYGRLVQPQASKIICNYCISNIYIYIYIYITYTQYKYLKIKCVEAVSMSKHAWTNWYLRFVTGCKMMWAVLFSKEPCNWFSANAVHCLRSKYIHRDDPSSSFFTPGQERPGRLLVASVQHCIVRLQMNR